MERINVYVLQPTQVAKGKHHMDQRAPKVVLPIKVTRMVHPASDMEGEQTGATFHKIPATIPAGSNGPHRGSCDTDTVADTVLMRSGLSNTASKFSLPRGSSWHEVQPYRETEGHAW